jgi:F-type H+-transporting ATPase subunit 8
MPQLIPFYFLNQLVFAILTLIVLIYVLSKYVLPLYTYKNVVRLYLTKLTNKS